MATIDEPIDFERGFVIEDRVIKGVKKDVDIPASNIAEVILKKLSDKPQHVGQIEVESGRQTTYREMREQSVRCALWLRKQGIRSNDVVVVCTHNQIDAYIPCFATLYVGATYNPWYHEVDLDSAGYLMSLTEPKFVFCCASALDTLRKAAEEEAEERADVKFVCFDDLESVLESQSSDEVEAFQPSAIAKNDTAMILFSSGSTGQPKGIAHTYDAMLKNVFGYFVMPRKPRFTLWYSSLYWMSGTNSMLQTVILDATRILHRDFDLDRMCQVIERFKVEWAFLGTLALTIFYKSSIYKRYKLESLRAMLTGSSRLSKNVMKGMKQHFPHVSFDYAYGLSEMGKLTNHSMDSAKNARSTGFVVPNVQLKIVDVESKIVLGHDEPGEICVKSNASMLGYVKNPRATAESVDGEGWVHTGDYGYYDANGELVVLDRINEMMRFRGNLISPSEIEELLLDHPGVLEVAVVGAPRDEHHERPVAFVKIVPGSQVTEQELLTLSSTLGDVKQLWRVEFLDELPHTASGKISRKGIREMARVR